MAGRRGVWTGGAWSVLVVVVAVVTACSPAEDAAGDGAERATPRPLELPAPSVGVVPTVQSVNGLTLPSEAYSPTLAQRAVVDTATDTLIAECMSRFGFRWDIRPPVEEPFSQMTRMYGIGDMERAQQYGYHLPPGELEDPDALAAREDAADADPTPIDPAFDLVLSGEGDTYQGQEIPAGGCIGEAHRELFGEEDIDPTHLAEDIAIAAYSASRSDSRVEDVVAAWSACMQDAGYDYATPSDPLGDWDSLSGTATEAEIQTAVADMTCKQQTNLIGVWYTIQCEYENDLIQQHVVRLDEIMKAWDDSARSAAEILGGTPTR